jgi:hypothetical protein
MTSIVVLLIEIKICSCNTKLNFITVQYYFESVRDTILRVVLFTFFIRTRHAQYYSNRFDAYTFAVKDRQLAFNCTLPTGLLAFAVSIKIPDVLLLLLIICD